MREVVQLQVGQFGNQAGHRFWEHLLLEHGLDPTGSCTSTTSHTQQLARISSYFDERDSKLGPSYIPRALVVDLDPAMGDWVRASAIGGIFRPDNFITGEYGTGLVDSPPLYFRMPRRLLILQLLIL
jgi:tubulin beta